MTHLIASSAPPPPEPPASSSPPPPPPPPAVDAFEKYNRVATVRLGLGGMWTV